MKGLIWCHSSQCPFRPKLENERNFNQIWARDIRKTQADQVVRCEHAAGPRCGELWFKIGGRQTWRGRTALWSALPRVVRVGTGYRIELNQKHTRAGTLDICHSCECCMCLAWIFLHAAHCTCVTNELKPNRVWCSLITLPLCARLGLACSLLSTQCLLSPVRMLMSFISVKQGERPEIETQPARGVSNCRSSQTIQRIVSACDCIFAGVSRCVRASCVHMVMFICMCMQCFMSFILVEQGEERRAGTLGDGQSVCCLWLLDVWRMCLHQFSASLCYFFLFCCIIRLGGYT